MKKFILATIFCCIAAFAFAQDTLCTKKGEKIPCKIVEVGINDITYKKASNPDGPNYVILKSDVWKIIYANGTVEMVSQDAMSVVPDNQYRARKRAITTRPFSPLSGSVSIGYQQAITATRAFAGEIGIIGPHVGTLAGNSSGAFVKVGFRLKRVPDVVMQGMQWGYNLGGYYVQPELAFSDFTRNVTTSVYNNSTGTYTTSAKNVSYYSGAFLITVGHQSIIGDIFTFDLSASLGYAASGNSDNNPNSIYDFGLPRYYFSHFAGGKNMPLAWAFNFSMGVLLK